MKFYRICSVEGGEYRSQTASGRFNLKYRIGEVTYPADGTTWMMAFQTLTSTEQYMGALVPMAILECAGKPCTDQAQLVSTPFEDEMQAFWEGREEGNVFNLPDLVFLEWCQPIRLVHPAPAPEVGHSQADPVLCIHLE